MRHKNRVLYAGLVTAMLCISICAGGIIAKVSALDNGGPDSAGEFDGANVYYEMSDTDAVNSPNMIIPIYFEKRINHHVNVSCAGKNGGNAQLEVGYLRPSDSKYIQIDGNLCNGDFNIPDDAFNSNLDTTIGYYEADIKVKLVDNSGFRAFKFGVAKGGIIGYSANSSSHFTVANMDRCSSPTKYSEKPAGGDCNNGRQKNGYYDYTLPFAPACNYNANSNPKYITLLDPDNPDSYIQPTAFGVKVVEKDLKGRVTDSNAVGNPAKTGTRSDNSEVWKYKIDIKPLHKYELVMNNVYANNVIQVQIPFDSINYNEECTAASATGASGGCDGITGVMYDRADSSAQYRAYIVNNAGSDPDASYASLADMQADLGDKISGISAPIIKTDSSHRFSWSPPSSNIHNNRGPWVNNVYVVYATQIGGNGSLKRVASSPYPISAAAGGGACAVPTCTSGATGSTSFDPKIIGETNNYTVWFKANGFGRNPLPDGGFTVVVKQPNGGTSSQTSAATWDGTDTIRSGNLSITPSQTGQYTVTWTYGPYTGYAAKSCSNVSDSVGYGPYFNVTGGDVGIGVGFGSSCTGNASAGIIGFNRNKADGTGPYNGAGSQLATMALGNIKSFTPATNPNGSDAGGASVITPFGLSFKRGAGSNVYGGSFGRNTWCAPDYYNDSLPDAGSAPVALTSGTTLTTSGTYRLAGSSIGSVKVAKGVHVVIVATSTPTITGDIVYEGASDGVTYDKPADIPRFELRVAGDIKINRSVGILSGFYSANKTGPTTGGTIFTCVDDAGGTNVTDPALCNKQLTVKGSLAAANTVNLRRTFGSIAAAGGVPAQPAETVQFGPQLWLSGLAGPSDKCSLSRTDPTGCTFNAYTSLPPLL